jgi:hypothetical protein
MFLEIVRFSITGSNLPPSSSPVNPYFHPTPSLTSSPHPSNLSYPSDWRRCISVLHTRNITRRDTFQCPGSILSRVAGSAHPLEIIPLSHRFPSSLGVLSLCLCQLPILQNHLIYDLPARDAPPAQKMVMGVVETLINHQTTTPMAFHGSSQIYFLFAGTGGYQDSMSFYQIIPLLARDKFFLSTGESFSAAGALEPSSASGPC